eukprot:scaffold64985_cov57-Phaeocystis_antarctica.AAC.2
MAVTRHLSPYILLQRLRRPIPSWPYRLHGAPAPSALPTQPPPTQPCHVIHASAEQAKPNVLHVGVERIGKGAALCRTLACTVTATHQWWAVGSQVDSRHSLCLDHTYNARLPLRVPADHQNVAGFVGVRVRAGTWACSACSR